MIIIFMVVLLKFFIQFKLILIKSNVFCNYIFIYYNNNHKCNIGTIINHKFNNFCHTKMKKIQFSQKFTRQVNENIYFLIKVIYNIL